MCIRQVTSKEKEGTSTKVPTWFIHGEGAISHKWTLAPLKEWKRIHQLAVDQLTKWVEAGPILDQEAKAVAQTFVEQFVTRFGSPIIIHIYKGRNFESKLLQKMDQLLGVKKTCTRRFSVVGE